MTTLELTKPLTHGIDTIHRLEIKEPTFAEIKKLGFPLSMTTREIDMGVVFEYLAALAIQPPVVLDQMCARDVMNATALIVGFFGDLEI